VTVDLTCLGCIWFGPIGRHFLAFVFQLDPDPGKLGDAAAAAVFASLHFLHCQRISLVFVSCSRPCLLLSEHLTHSVESAILLPTCIDRALLERPCGARIELESYEPSLYHLVFSHASLSPKVMARWMQCRAELCCTGLTQHWMS